jgi:hypothetical protein
VLCPRAMVAPPHDDQPVVYGRQSRKSGPKNETRGESAIFLPAPPVSPDDHIVANFSAVAAAGPFEPPKAAASTRLPFGQLQ